MVKKTVGYVKLEWTCPRCGTRNPGPNKFCTGCGGPQPEDVQFEQAAQEKLIEDEAEIARAGLGPDIHCPYCGSRNPGGAKFCGACGGDLAGGQARQAGRVVGAFRSEPVAPVVCPSCGTENPGDALTCANCGTPLRKSEVSTPSLTPAAKPALRLGRKVPVIGIVLGAVVLCVLAVGGIMLLGRTEDLQGQVVGTQWSRSITIEELGPVQLQDWRDDIPSDIQPQSCDLKYRTTSDEPAAVSTEVCGTPYTVDTGGGYGEVVQDCTYDVYDEWCEYTAQEWRTVNTATSSGSDLSPAWPVLSLSQSQRAGDEKETYEVTFQTPQGVYEYTPADVAEYALFETGSEWVLRVNALNEVVSVEPAD
jgi:ribosomal protein L40E